jgi:adenylate kinase
LASRADDNEQTIRERLRVYHEQTRPVLEVYAKRGQLTRVPGDTGPDKVFEQIARIVDQWTGHRG